MGAGTKESTLSRWSRLKQEAAQTSPVSEEVAAPAVAVDLEAPIAAEGAAAPAPLTDADMPDLDSLGEDSDFTGFMSPGVSDKLRNLALRKLFHAPVFNIRDGLDEYDEDYTSFEKLGDIVTCDMKHQIEVQERKLREAQEAENQARADAELEDQPEDTQDMDTEDDAEVETLDDIQPSAQTPAAVPTDNRGKADKSE